MPGPSTCSSARSCSGCDGIIYTFSGALAAMAIGLPKWSKMCNVYGVSCAHASEPSPPCPSTCPSGRSCSAFTTGHVHILGAIGAMSISLPKWSQLITFTAHHARIPPGHRRNVSRFAQVLAFAPRSRRYHVPMSRKPPSCLSAGSSGRSCSTFTAHHVHMLRLHRRHVHRLAQVAGAVQRLRRVMCTFFGAFVALSIDEFKCSNLLNAYGDVLLRGSGHHLGCAAGVHLRDSCHHFGCAAGVHLLSSASA